MNMKKIEDTLFGALVFLVLLLTLSATLIWLKDLMWKSIRIDGIYMATSYYVLATLLAIHIIRRAKHD